MLRQTLQLNALPHLLAARWLAAVLERRGLFGIHPGVEFRDEDGVLIAEADVVLLFTNGTLALGECKLTPRGLRQGDIDKLESLADAVGASWTFYAVPAWSSECGEPWRQLRASHTERPRFVLTNEQLVRLDGADPGDDPFRARPSDNPEEADDERRAACHKRFVAHLVGGISRLDEGRRTVDELLDEE